MRKFIRGLGWTLMAANFISFCGNIMMQKSTIFVWVSLKSFVISFLVNFGVGIIGFILIHVDDKKESLHEEDK